MSKFAALKQDMEQKKTDKANLEKGRGRRLLIGLAVSVVLFWGVLEYRMNPGEGGFDAEAFDELVEEMELNLKRDKPDMIPVEQKQPEKHPSEDIKVVDEVLEEKPVDDLDNQLAIEGDPADAEKKSVEPIEQTPKDLNDNPLNMRIVEQLPEYPGGLAEFTKWLTKNLKYPEAARKQKIEGKVVVSFIINKDGSISDAKVAKGVNPLLDQEAMRVINMMPKWKPGVHNDQPCRTLFAVPIHFKI